MKVKKDKEIRNYKILWDELEMHPSIQLKTGIKRKVYPLTSQFTKNRGALYFVNNFVELKGHWDNSPGFGSLLSLTLKNISDETIRITRLVFPTENGIDKFIKKFDPANVSFLRNGYQSWSTSRSYKFKDKPLRPWLSIISLASSNMSNLPSNISGYFCSDMYSVITDLESNSSFLVGQSKPFNQFFYIRLKLFKKDKKTNYFELVYDFGRKLLKPGESIKLDGIIMARDISTNLQINYFNYIKKSMNLKIMDKKIKGWCSWYYYYNKITPQIIYDNLSVIKTKKNNFNLIQIDDGYQKNTGDWLDLNPKFIGEMKKLSSGIKEEGFIPGLWIAPFICSANSELFKIHPEYILRNEYGRPILVGYNPVWRGGFYYALDITNPRFEEYLRKVIRTVVHEWGYEYLKLDFLFAACLRGGTHHNLDLSRAEVLKYGIKIIKEEAGKNIILSGCGMPLSAGISNVDFMRVGPDTAPAWIKLSGTFFRTGAMLGAKNSIRNFIARSLMNKQLWINDPDCVMIRKKKTRLTIHQRMTQINAIILSGGTLLYSDNMMELDREILEMIDKIDILSDSCFNGTAIPLDLMEKQIAEFYYNTNGYLGIFNFKNTSLTKELDILKYSNLPDKIKSLTDAWTHEVIYPDLNKIILKKMPANSSRLFKINFI